MSAPLMEMYLSYGISALKGKCPALADGVTAVPSFTLLSHMSQPIGLDYFGVYDGFFGAYSAKHFAERLHIAVAMGIHDELVDEPPRYRQHPDDLEGWWRKTVLDAFRLVDEELVARVKTGIPVGCPAVFSLVLEKYIVLANRGAACKAVIYRGEEAVQLTSQRRPEPYNQMEEKNNVQGGHVVGSSYNLKHDTVTSRPTLFRPYFPEPKVLRVKREPRDKFLILATGSFWDKITPAEACNYIQKRLCTLQIMPCKTSLHDTGSLTILANELAEYAILKGCQRNVTIVIILFKNFRDEHHPGTSKK